MLKFSVIIPAYNAEKRIARTLDSVKNQTYRNFEIAITDDGSRDSTADTVKEYMRQNPGLKILLSRQANSGIGAARNNSITRSDGNYLAFLDDDDYWYPDKLSSVAGYLSKHPGAGLVSHRVYKVYPDGKKRRFPNSKPKEPCYQSLLLKGNTLYISSTVVSKESLMKVGGFTEDKNLWGVEDYDLFLRLAYSDVKFGFLESFLGEIARRRDSATWSIDKLTRSVLNVIDLNREYALLKCGIPEQKLKSSIKRRKAGEIMSSVVRLCRNNEFSQAGNYIKLLLETVRER